MSIFQDSRGYLWIGTNGGGLCVYDSHQFKTFSKKDGLINNTVLSISESRDGSLWFGTEGGMAQLSPETQILSKPSFKNFSMKNGLKNNTVRSIIEDNEGNLWLATSGGVTRLVRNTEYKDSIDFMTISKDEGLSNSGVICLIEDKNNNLWAGTSWGLNKIIQPLEKGSSHKIIKYSTQNGINSNVIITLFEDRDGYLWVGTNKGLSRSKTINLAADSIEFADYTDVMRIDKTRIHDINQDENGDLWICSLDDGVYVVRPLNGQDYSMISHLTEKRGLVSNSIYSMLIDREGNKWFNGDLGISKYMGNKFMMYSQIDGLLHNIVWAINLDSKNRLWIGTYGGGISIIQNQMENFDKSLETSIWCTYLTKEDGLPNDKIYTIIEDRKGNTWIGLRAAICRYNDQGFTNFYVDEVFPYNSVLALLEDNDGSIWAGTMSGLYRYQDGKTKEFVNFSQKFQLKHNHVNDLLQDRSGNLWIGNMGGLAKVSADYINVQNDSDYNSLVQHYTINEGLGSDYVSCLESDNEGNVWAGTFGSGISKVIEHENGKTEFLTLTSEDGLADDEVVSLFFDDQGYMWIGGNQGIERLNISKYNKTGDLEIKHYGKEEGFLGIECNHNAICQDSEGSIWIGTVKGVMKYNPKSDDFNKVETKTHISRYRVFLKDTVLTQHVILPYNLNHLTFDFTGICFTNPEKVTYQYYLEGFDEDWSPITKEKTSTYSNLAPGEYTFKVKSANNNGVWNEYPTTYNFVIATPFWETWWFYNLCGIILIIFVYGLIKYRLATIEASNKMLEELVEERSSELKVSEEKLRNLIENMNEGVILADNDGVIQYVNDQMCKMVGYGREELLGQRGQNLLLTDESQKLMQKMSANRLRDKSDRYEIEIQKKSGEKIWVSISASPHRDNKGDIIGSFGIHTNISARKRAEEEVKVKNLQLEQKNVVIANEKEKVEKFNWKLTKAYENLKILEDFKESMMSMIVHDLKNPLNTIINFSMQKPVKHTMDTIHQTGIHLLNMVLNILDIQKYEEAKINLERAIFPVSLVTHDAIRQVKTLIKQNNLNIINKVEHQFHGYLDFEIISRVLVNLLTNAIKHTHQGGTITISAAYIEDNGQFVQMSVSDNGEGIPSDKIDQVFEKFTQIGPKTSSKTQSTGLGLVFCKLMMEAHGGRIWLQSELGKGSTFFFSIPMSAEEILDVHYIIPEENGEITKIRAIRKEYIKNRTGQISGNHDNYEIKITLTKEEKEILSPLQSEFSHLEVYDTSKTLALLDEIKANNNNITYWKDGMVSAIFNRDQKFYDKLLELISEN
ncbi:PAS domain S-box protein, partial [Candidatus Amoebophilus asiaticus]|nr:PAS domain S-box protein [Candidatus Amoebophilus asiaticus]